MGELITNFTPSTATSNEKVILGGLDFKLPSVASGLPHRFSLLKRRGATRTRSAALFRAAPSPI